MKHLATIIALVISANIAVECNAQRENRGNDRQQGDGERRQRDAADPAETVARMLEEFDSNGDNKLDRNELVAMFTSMRENRARGNQGNRQGRQGGDGNRDRAGNGDGRQRNGADRDAGQRDRGNQRDGRGNAQRRGGDDGAKGGGVNPARPGINQ